MFGYTVVFDVSDRGGRYRENPMLPGPDWFSGKSGDRAAPMGPYVTPSAFLPDPQALRLTTRIDDRVVQDGATADMIYSVAHLVAYASQIMTLHPGDVIATGTPDGGRVGARTAGVPEPGPDGPHRDRGDRDALHSHRSGRPSRWSSRGLR